MEIKIMKMDDGYELFVNSVLVKKGKVLAHIGSMIPVFSSGCGCCGVNNGQLFERTWDELLDIINNQNKPMDKRTEVDELY